MFKNVRLVCRLRRYPGQSPPTSLPSESVPDIAAQSQPTSTLKEDPSLDVNGLSTSTPSDALANPTQYFIMKSLTKNELAWSVANNVWTTQSHNESVLNEAFMVIFSQYLFMQLIELDFENSLPYLQR